QIPENDFYQPGINYRIQINSTNPAVSSDFPSDPFNVKNKPPSPLASNNSPICAGSTLQLTASDIPNATFYWTGPGGYTGIGRTPSRSNVTAAMAGIYTVTATVNGCTSNPASTNVIINNASTPTA